jgi:hypothetical protein
MMRDVRAKKTVNGTEFRGKKHCSEHWSPCLLLAVTSIVNLKLGGFMALTVVTREISVFWDVRPCSLVEV